MRQVFSSPRLENVEAVAKLLADEGIEVRIENGRTFRSSIRGNFSYRDQVDSGPRPSVWVVRSDDQPRARQLLRDAGLLGTGPTTQNSFLPTTGHAAKANATASPRRARMRLGLLVLAAVAIALVLNQFRNPGWDLPEPAPARTPAATTAIDPALQQIATGAEAVHQLPVPPALAAYLARRAIGTAAEACIAIDGEAPVLAVIEAAAALGLALSAESACTPADARPRVRIARYLTDGSGTGTIEVETRGSAAGEAAVRERLRVQRDGDDWQVLATL